MTVVSPLDDMSLPEGLSRISVRCELPVIDNNTSDPEAETIYQQ